MTASRRGFARGQLAAGSGNHRRRILREGADVAERAPAAFRFLGHRRGVDQRTVGADGDGQLGPLQQVQDVEHVLGALRRPDIARHDGDALHVDLRRTAQQHDQRGAIVAEEAGIGVEPNDILGSAPKARQHKESRQQSQHEFSL